MIKNQISQYVRTMFDESRNGELTVGDADDRFDCPVQWDEQTAEALALECSELVSHLTFLAGQYDKLLTQTLQLTKVQLDIWNTYLKPFPKHGLDMQVLQAVWEKLETGETITPPEQALADAYVKWFEKNALARLSVKCCEPIQLINRARRYGKLVRLNAPAIVLESEAKRLAEEFVLYHCLRQ